MHLAHVNVCYSKLKRPEMQNTTFRVRHCKHNSIFLKRRHFKQCLLVSCPLFFFHVKGNFLICSVYALQRDTEKQGCSNNFLYKNLHENVGFPSSQHKQ